MEQICWSYLKVKQRSGFCNIKQCICMQPTSNRDSLLVADYKTIRTKVSLCRPYIHITVQLFHRPPPASVCCQRDYETSSKRDYTYWRIPPSSEGFVHRRSDKDVHTSAGCSHNTHW